MNSLTLKFFLAGLLQLILFLGIFTLLQHDLIYKNTLGKISSNYIRIENENEYEIKQVKQPFVSLSDSKFKTWDADIYHCIRENMYTKENGCYSQVKGAFFPLFPLLWKFSGLNSIGISLFNYFIFILSIAILVQQLVKSQAKDKLRIFLLLITLPSSVIYFIPYTESLFLFTMTMALIGANKNKYWLYFFSCLALAMLRPATLFILLAIFAVDVFCLVSHRKWGLFVKFFTKKALPFLLGYILVIAIQYASTGSLLTMLDAQTYWQGKIGSFEHISDWSLEGFGLNVFSVFFIALPAAGFLIFSMSGKKIFKSNFNESVLSTNYTADYFFLVSVFYLSGILLFILLTSGGNLHSFFRFTMTSPPFYIALLFLLNFLQGKKRVTTSLFYLIPLALLIFFLVNTDYGGNRMAFTFTGMYLSILTFMFLIHRQSFPGRIRGLITGLLVFCSVIWNAYLLNVFLSDGWIFT